MAEYDKLMHDCADSAECLLKSIQNQIKQRNFQQALSTVGSLNICLSNAEVYRALSELSGSHNKKENEE